MRRAIGVRNQSIITDMKTLRIEEVANGWVVYEPYPEPGVYDSTKTHVFETVAGLQKALPTLLGKPAPVVFDFGQPNQLGASYDPGTPECHKCKSNEFVIRHPRIPGHWLCERGTCQLDFVV